MGALIKAVFSFKPLYFLDISSGLPRTQLRCADPGRGSLHLTTMHGQAMLTPEPDRSSLLFLLPSYLKEISLSAKKIIVYVIEMI
jgi:hypothetical protein